MPNELDFDRFELLLLDEEDPFYPTFLATPKCGEFDVARPPIVVAYGDEIWSTTEVLLTGEIEYCPLPGEQLSEMLNTAARSYYPAHPEAHQHHPWMD